MGHPHTGRPRAARRPAATFLHRPRSFTKRRPPAWPSACPRRTFAPPRGVSGQVLQQLLSPPPVHRSVRGEKRILSGLSLLLLGINPFSGNTWPSEHPVSVFRNQGFEGSAPPDAARCLKRFFPPARSRSLPSSAPPPPAQAAPRQKPVQSPNPPLFAQPRSPPAFVTSTAGAARAPWRQRPESE